MKNIFNELSPGVAIVAIFSLFLIWPLSAQVSSIGVDDGDVAMADYQDGASEMQVYRFILDKKITSYQDLADLLVMEAGEFGQYRSKKARYDRAIEYDVLDFESIDDPSYTLLTRGAAAKAIMNVFMLPRGFLFMFTGIERYAFRDLQNLGVVGFTVSPYSNLSGSQLIGNFNIARKKAEEKEYWGREKPVDDNEA